MARDNIPRPKEEDILQPHRRSSGKVDEVIQHGVTEWTVLISHD